MTKLKTKIVTKPEKFNFDPNKNQIVTKNLNVTVFVVTVVVTVVVIVTSFSKNNLTPQQPMRFSGQLFAILAMFPYFLQRAISLSILNNQTNKTNQIKLDMPNWHFLPGIVKRRFSIRPTCFCPKVKYSKEKLPIFCIFVPLHVLTLKKNIYNQDNQFKWLYPKYTGIFYVY